MKIALLTALTFVTGLVCIAQPPAGYYTSASGKNCASLKTTLKSIVTTGHSPQSYADLWNQFMVSDVKPREVGSGSSMVIWDIYSDRPGANDPYNFTPGTGTGGQQDQGSGGGSEGQFYNREHTIPLSWFNGSVGSPGPATDYLHIFPTDKYVNGLRGSNPYGKVATASTTTQNGSKSGTSAVAGITGTVFEPIDSFKGDVARAFLYFVTRYEDNMSAYATNTEAVQAFEPNTYPSVDIPYLKMMIQWHELDPVSIKEINRNNAAYTYQGNRNPFIDSPQFVNRVWSSTCPGLSALPIDIVSFGGKQQDDQVMLEWVAEHETNFDKFVIERSVNGIHFTSIGEVNSSNSRNYNFQDNIEGLKGRRLYYRLKLIDKDGAYRFSNVFSLHIPMNSKMNIYPNPATTFMQLQTNTAINGNVLIRVTDNMGKMVQQHNKKVNGNTIRLSTDELNNGTYTVIMYYNGEQYFQKVVVAK